jgi:hypothetical protein
MESDDLARGLGIMDSWRPGDARTAITELTSGYDYVFVLRCRHTEDGDFRHGRADLIRLDDNVRATLEAEAKDRGIGLATYLRQLAAGAAREARRKRIRVQSATVACYVAENSDARAFYEARGTRAADIG